MAVVTWEVLRQVSYEVYSVVNYLELNQPIVYLRSPTSASHCMLLNTHTHQILSTSPTYNQRTLIINEAHKMGAFLR